MDNTKRFRITKLSALLLCIFSLASCALEPLDNNAKVEEFTRNFIKEFGLVDPNQDWNMAKAATVTLNVGPDRTSSIKVYSKYGDRYFIVADLQGLKGIFDVPIDIPKTSEEIKVCVDGAVYYGRVGQTIDCTGQPVSRDIASAATTIGNYKVAVGYAQTGNRIDVTDANILYDMPSIKGVGSVINYTNSEDNCYEYFNVQQLSPIVANKPLTNGGYYYSLNNPNNIRSYTQSYGVLPESAVADRSWTDEPTGVGTTSFSKDFVYELGTAGKLTIFPYYHNAGYIHRLGVYLVDNQGNPLKADGTAIDLSTASTQSEYNALIAQVAKYPVYIDKQLGDLQIAPKRPENIKIALVRSSSASDDHSKVDNNRILVEKGHSIDLNDYVEIQDNSGNAINLNNYTGRVVFHAYSDNYTVSDNGILSANSESNEYQIVKIGYDNKTTGYNNVTMPGPNDYQNGGYREIYVQVVNYNPNTAQQPTLTLYTSPQIPSTLTLTVGDEETFTVTKLTENNGSDNVWDTYKSRIKAVHWDSNIDFKLENGIITVKALSVTSAVWPKIYYDVQNNDWNESDGDPILADIKVVVEAPAPTTKTHTYTTQTYTGLPGSLRYSDYMTEAQEGSATTLSTEEFDCRNWENNRNLQFDKRNVEIGQQIKVTFTTDVNGLKIGSWDNSAREWNEGSFTVDGKIATFTIDSQWQRLITNYGFSLYGQGTFNKVELITPAQTAHLDENTLKAAIVSHYRNNNISGTCTDSDCSETLNSNDQSVDITVNITNSTQDNFAYTITLSRTVTISSAPKLNRKPGPAPKPKRAQSSLSGNKLSAGRSSAPSFNVYAAPASRVDVDASWPSILDYRNTDGWTEVNKIWDSKLPVGDEGASFPVDQPLLARSRGYDIVVTVNGQPYTGNVGFYIDVFTNPSANYSGDEGNKYEHWNVAWPANSNPTINESDKIATYFSQSSLNRMFDGTAHTWDFSYATRFKHPVSNREFMTFEDWKIEHAFEDDYCNKCKTRHGSTGNSGGSDRDFNDLIYVVQTYTARPKDIYEFSNNNGYTWIWALEDLGSTDDFDFNDVVIQISSITTTTGEYEEDGVTIKEGTEKIVKRVTFQPLAAGGTLPIYIHHMYLREDYVLCPGEFDLTEGSTNFPPTSEADGGLEYHKWFGDYTNKTMINTGGTSVPYSAIQNCVLIVPTNFQVNITKEPGGTIDANDQIFYVTVRGDASRDEIMGDWEQRGEGDDVYMVPLAETGMASQSFIIVEETVINDVSTVHTKWEWPSERAHIMLAYPRFKDWVNSGYKNWYTDGKNSKYVISR